MSKLEKIKQAVARNEKAISLRPASGQGTAVSKARLVDGLHCEIEEGPWHLTVHGSRSIGGEGTSPSPGVYGRAALGSCLLVGYVVWAAKLGITLTYLEVELEADYDDRGFYGLDDTTPAGHSEIRYTVTVESPAPTAEILRFLGLSEAHSPWLTNISRPVKVERKVQIKNRDEISQPVY